MKKKNVFLACLTAALVCCTIFAIPYVKMIDNKSIKTDEYQMFEELKQKSAYELKGIGFTDDEINGLKNMDFVQELKKRSKLSNKELANMGYNAQQIKDFKDFHDTKLEVRRLAVVCNVSSNLFYTDGYEYIIDYSWHWSSVSFNTKRDVIRINWSGALDSGEIGALRVDKNPSHTYCKVMYSYAGVVTATDNAALKWDNELSAISARFDVERAPYTGEYALSGSGRITLLSAVPVSIKEIAVGIAYGHNHTIISYPYMNSSGGGFSTSMEEEADYESHRYDKSGNVPS